MKFHFNNNVMIVILKIYWDFNIIITMIMQEQIKPTIKIKKNKKSNKIN